MKLHLHHVAIICSDYQRSKDFYVRLLGLKVLREEYRSAGSCYGAAVESALGNLSIRLDEHA